MGNVVYVGRVRNPQVAKLAANMLVTPTKQHITFLFQIIIFPVVIIQTIFRKLLHSYHTRNGHHLQNFCFQLHLMNIIIKNNEKYALLKQRRWYLINHETKLHISPLNK